MQNPPRLSLPTLEGKQRKPRPITWEEQRRLIAELPEHLRGPVEFAINTGARDNVVANLQWDWLVPVPKFGVCIAVVPKEYVKGGTERKILMLNSNALAAINAQRSRHPVYVFVCQRRTPKTATCHDAQQLAPFETINNTAWQSARVRAGLDDLHVHDLRHTFAGRLSAGGVPADVIAALLWHAKNSITEHYMGKQLLRLQAAVDLIVEAPEDEDVSIDTLLATHARERARGG